MQVTMYKFEIDFSSRIDEESSYYKVAIDCSVTITILPFSYRKCWYNHCKNVAKPICYQHLFAFYLNHILFSYIVKISDKRCLMITYLGQEHFTPLYLALNRYHANIATSFIAHLNVTGGIFPS